MFFGPDDIGQYVANIWDTVLGLPVQPGAAPVVLKQPGDYLTGCVQITGGWDGAVTLDYPLALARQAAGILFGAEALGTTLDQVHDTIGELTNILGGNLKALLPGPCYLSLPAVADGTDYALRVLRGRVVSQAGFVCGDLPFRVTVIERDHPTQEKR